MKPTVCKGEFVLVGTKPKRTPEQVVSEAKKIADAEPNWSWEEKVVQEGFRDTVFSVGLNIKAQARPMASSVYFTIIDSSGQLGCNELCAILTNLFQTDLASLKCEALPVQEVPGQPPVTVTPTTPTGKAIDWAGIASVITAVTVFATFIWREVIKDIRAEAKKKRKKRKKKEEDYWD
jgi:hypothetical protein